MPARFLVAIFVAALLLVPTPSTAADGETVSLETAQRELSTLTDAVKKSKSINPEINGALDAVLNAYKNLEEPVKPAPKEIPEGTGEDEAKALKAENDAALSDYNKRLKAHQRSAAKFYKDTEKQFFKALTLQKIHRQSETNIRDDVNIKAAQCLGATGNADLSGSIIKAMETKIFKSKVDASTLLLDEVFAALGKLKDPKALAWMTKEFTHSKSSPRKEVDRLMAAHKAMILFPVEGEEKIDGKLRYDLVAAMVKTYSSVESQANQSSNDSKIQAAKDFWDRIKGDTIKATQYFAGSPTNDEGEILATMEEFRVWFGDHKNPKRPPWRERK